LLSGEDAALKLHTRVIYQDVELSAGHRYALDVDPAMRGFVYVLSGQLAIESQLVNKAESCFIENYEHLVVNANTDARFMLCFGVPHNQPINQHGSFVD